MNYRVFELDAHTWRIEEYDEISSVYLYLLEGDQSALLLDTGLGQIDLPQLVAGLTRLPVQVLNTHAHFDHIGGNGLFDRVMIPRDDQQMYRLHTSPELQAQFPRYHFPAPCAHIDWIDSTGIISLGGRDLELIPTPGHTPGAIALLDPDRRWIFTGDTCCRADVLLNMEGATTVETYAESIALLQRYRPRFDLVWPSHHSVPLTPDILDLFQQAAQQICCGTAQGDQIQTPVGEALALQNGPVRVVYLADRIRD